MFAFQDNDTDAQVPALGKAVFPVDRIPNWGAMRSSAEWDRPYEAMTEADFVPVPSYDLAQLTIPISSLTNPIIEDNIHLITAKLFYSTRYFAAYDLDADEFTGNHAGVDLKLPLGTPVRVIGGGIVREAGDGGALGTYVMVEHRLKNGEKFFSIYGHLRSMKVRAGDAVGAGQVIGEVGFTGISTGPHLHLQVDRDDGSAKHMPFTPLQPLTRNEAAKWSVNPITFIQEHVSASW
ncbi:MAG: M23 family metallopeptidase [Candidatus Peribacteraceae bacterium]|nr:M23 family metallopeptidase [Candidatus Peribacteraceae bacterium]